LSLEIELKAHADSEKTIADGKLTAVLFKVCSRRFIALTPKTPKPYLPLSTKPFQKRARVPVKQLNDYRYK
jgi:uncharacterized glyoxalase superfamily metalloenzyme YdcJ